MVRSLSSLLVLSFTNYCYSTYLTHSVTVRAACPCQDIYIHHSMPQPENPQESFGQREWKAGPHPHQPTQPKGDDVGVLTDRLNQDPRFNPPPPSKWKRAALVFVLVILFWFALATRGRMNRKPTVVYADRYALDSLRRITADPYDRRRYSKDYKYRPAASPIITEVLKDGRTRLRGAMPTALE